MYCYSSITNNRFKHNGKTIHNHVARTNVSEKFWGRKHKVNQHEICDYLRYWRNKSNWSTKKIDEHFGYRHTQSDPIPSQCVGLCTEYGRRAINGQKIRKFKKIIFYSGLYLSWINYFICAFFPT